MLMTAIIRVPKDGLESFRAYEDQVIPLQADHGAVLERRVRTADGTTEVHLVRFPSQAAADAYMADERRHDHRHLFDASGAVMEVLVVDDVLG
jgi:hypothetical protein